MREIVETRLALRCESLGLASPPVAALVKVRRNGGGCEVRVDGFGGALAPLVEWLERQQATQIVIDPTRGIRAAFLLPPPALAALGARCVLRVALRADGGITLDARGEREEIRALSARLLQGSEGARVEHVGAPPVALSILTAAQDDAIRVAALAGYYQIPRALNLVELAARLSVSPASISERLRRAEARLVARYLAEVGPTRVEGAASLEEK